MAGVLASVAAYETEVRKERRLAGIAKAKEQSKKWGGRKPGTFVRLTRVWLHGGAAESGLVFSDRNPIHPFDLSACSYTPEVPSDWHVHMNRRWLILSQILQ
jgi:hypothetical protein